MREKGSCSRLRGASNRASESGIQPPDPLERPMKAAILLALLPIAAQAGAQNPLQHPLEAIETRYARSQPIIRYALRADSADPSGYDVTIHIRNAPDTFRLA